MSETSAPTEDFLRAEEAAEQLAKSLKRLDREADGYSTAGKTLEQVATDVRELASRTSDVASRTSDAVEAIRSIGSVQILEQVQALSARGQKNEDAVESMGRKIDALAEQATIIKEETTSMESTIEGLQAAIVDSSKATQTLIQDNAVSIQALIQGTAASIQVQIEAIAKVAKNALYAAVAAAILAALAAVLTRF